MPATLLALDLGGHVLCCGGDIPLANAAACCCRAVFQGLGYGGMQVGWMALVD